MDNSADLGCVTFVVVQSIEKGAAHLSVLPEHWVVANGWNRGIQDDQSDYMGSDIMHWPANKAGNELIDQADLDVNIKPDSNCRVYRCAIKRRGLRSRSEVSFYTFAFEHSPSVLSRFL